MNGHGSGPIWRVLSYGSRIEQAVRWRTIGERLPGDPRSIGGFRVVGRLDEGRGRVGVVYLADHPRLGAAALRLVHVAGAGERSFRDRFAHEIEAARSARGPRLAHVLATDPEAEVPWVATRFLDGPTLAEAVDPPDDHGPDRGSLRGDALAALALALADAVATIHRSGLVHGGLSPSNVVLTGESPVVTDLGIGCARATLSWPDAGSPPPDPDRRAPEQMAGEPPGQPADVYAWGRVVAFAAGGEPGSLPEPLGQLVTVATDDDPNGRPSIDEIVDALLAHAPPASPDEVASMLVTRGWSASALLDRPPAPRADRSSTHRRPATPAAAGHRTDEATDHHLVSRAPTPDGAHHGRRHRAGSRRDAAGSARVGRIGPAGGALRTTAVYGLGGNLALAVLPVVVLVAYLRFVDRFHDRVLRFLITATSEGRLGYDGPRTLHNVDQFRSWIPAVLVAFSAVTLAGAMLRRRQVGPAALRTYAACSALVETALGAALVVPVGFVTLVYEVAQITSPAGRHPGFEALGGTTFPTTWLILEVVAIVVAFLGIALILASLHRLVTAVMARQRALAGVVGEAEDATSPPSL